MQIKGKIVSWNDDKGFGFVEPCLGGRKIFLHVKALSNRSLRPKIGQLVTYRESTDARGRPCAADALLAGERVSIKSNRKTHRATQSSGGHFALSVAAIFLVGVAASVIWLGTPIVLLAAYVVLSLISLAIYAGDKAAAERGRWRTAESTLHLFALMGGWPGAYVAQQTMRHKTKKESFQVVFWATVLINVGAFLWLSLSGGAESLRSLLNSII
jgi:uncharacterized membrane protein YsdA (DUF1294 family)/cold shock CspA family protein